MGQTSHGPNSGQPNLCHCFPDSKEIVDVQLKIEFYIEICVITLDEIDSTVKTSTVCVALFLSNCLLFDLLSLCFRCMQNRAKWLRFWQVWHVLPKAGHRFVLCFVPQYLHSFCTAPLVTKKLSVLKDRWFSSLYCMKLESWADNWAEINNINYR